MGWGSGRKSFLEVIALRPRSGTHLQARGCLRSGSLGINSSFLRCAARLARVGLFLRFQKYHQDRHRCNDGSNNAAYALVLSIEFAAGTPRCCTL